MSRVSHLVETAWAGCTDARTTSCGGGGDYRTFRVEGPYAEAFVDELVTLAEQLDPGWWKIRRAAR